MTTLSRPNIMPRPENLAALPRLPRDEGGPGLCRALAGASLRARRQAVRARAFHVERVGRRARGMNSKPPRIAVSPMMARATTTIGWQLWSAWWLRSDFLIRRRCWRGKKPGPKPIDVRHTANPSIWRTDPASLALFMDQVVFVGFRRRLCEHRQI